MDLSILDEAILYSALSRYTEYCNACLKNPENESQFTFIKGDLSIAAELKGKIKADYLSQGGELDSLG